MGNETSKELLAKLQKAEKEARKKAINERERFTGLQIRPTTSIDGEEVNIEPDSGNWVGFGFDLHPKVTILSAMSLIAFIIMTLSYKAEAGKAFSTVLSTITQNFGWFFVLSVNAFIIAALFFAFSKFGKIKIGGKNANPEFSTPAWFAMLLSAGMGIGLMFWSVGEPIYHYISPSPMFNGVAANTPEAAQAAMGTTYFHWGIHAWGTYAIVGLGLSFFAYNRGLPLTIRSIFYPILGNKIYSFWGDLVDVLSVLATLMGLATSLGLGVKQINAGLNFLFGVQVSTTTQMILIAGITLFATLSVMSGLDGGVKKLSKMNMGLAGIFMLFILIAGPTVFILGGFTQNLGYYITKLPQLSFWTETFRDSNWQGSWTVFYWAWWISWSPFVGMFIARISKGRTVREFVLGVMIIPTILSFLWMSVFGGSAIHLQATGAADIVAAVKSDVATAMFVMFKNFPMTELLSGIGVLLVTIFFVTSSDSGSLVVDHLTSGGKLDSPIPQRVFWAIMEGVVASVLLVGGGLAALQTASVITGLPFAVVLLLIIYSLYKGLSEEVFIEEAVTKRLASVRETHRMEQVIEDVAQQDS